MHQHQPHNKENTNKVPAVSTTKQGANDTPAQITDMRPEAVAQRRLQEIADNSSQVQQLQAYQLIADNADHKNNGTGANVIQKKENNTGLPDQLKTGIEDLSGHSLSDVNVHYNSARPAQLNALAYAQGTDIHVAPGQEKHLPHEAWHVVQQKQGRVRPTLQMKGNIPVNDDKSLEKEADTMGAQAMQMQTGNTIAQTKTATGTPVNNDVVQRVHAVNTNVAMETARQGDTHYKMVDTAEKGKGDEVHDSVGVNDIFRAPFTHIGGNGIANMWRAHGVARRFGGGGTANNVGWWPQTVEDVWTAEEWKVAGVADEAQALSTDWAAGRNEEGTYRVARTLAAGGPVLAAYKDPVIAAVNWGYDNARAAWTRALAQHVISINNQNNRDANLRELVDEKARRKQSDLDTVTRWFDTYLKPAADQVIDTMTLTYTETKAGTNQNPTITHERQTNKKIVPLRTWYGRPKANPDAKRNITHTGTNASVGALQLTQSPQNLWAALVANNAIIRHRTLPALTLSTVNRLDLFAEGQAGIRFRPARLADGFGAPELPPPPPPPAPAPPPPLQQPPPLAIPAL